MSTTRREALQTTGLAVVGSALGRDELAAAQPSPQSFNIDRAFAEFMQGTGATPADGGGRVVLSRTPGTWRTPLVSVRGGDRLTWES